VKSWRLPIAADVDVVEARQQGRALAAVAGFSSGEQDGDRGAISEIARNILMYGQEGRDHARSCPDRRRSTLNSSHEPFARGSPPPTPCEAYGIARRCGMRPIDG